MALGTSKGLAASIANNFIGELGLVGPAAERPFPFRRAARALGVSIEYVESTDNDQPWIAAEGSLWLKETDSPTLFRDRVARIVSTDALRKRFTICHELAHRLIELQLQPETWTSWPSVRLESICNQIAGRLLVSDEAMKTVVGPELTIEIPYLLSLAARFGSSISNLVKRLGDAVVEDVVTVTNCAIVVSPDVSARKRADLAPRILVRCTPRHWFLPLNRRIESVGMRRLYELFERAQAFTPGRVNDTIELWSKSSRKRISDQVPIDYVVFPTSDTRLMLAVFDTPRLASAKTPARTLNPRPLMSPL